VWVTHGFTAPLVRWLGERGVEAQAVATRFEGESDEPDADVQAAPDA
jgi:putative mRNA 3-end processing factor